MIYQTRPSIVAMWPAWEVGLVDHYLAKQPSPAERIELAIANFSSLWANFHTAKGGKGWKIAEFLPYANPWKRVPNAGNYSDVDRSIMVGLGMKL